MSVTCGLLGADVGLRSADLGHLDPSPQTEARQGRHLPGTSPT